MTPEEKKTDSRKREGSFEEGVMDTVNERKSSSPEKRKREGKGEKRKRETRENDKMRR
jgi:hypothetical protein